MLSLKQGLSLETIQSLWSPIDDTSLEAWYQFKNGIVLDGAKVTQWNDSSSNSHNMVQATSAQQPTYDTGALAFNAASETNLQTTSQISITADFTLGIRMSPTSTDATFVGDNTSANQFFKISAENEITITTGSGSLLLTTAEELGDDYIVITRSSGTFKLYRNGTLESSGTLAGTIEIDSIGVRATDANGFTGTIKEIQIYSSESAYLLNNINERLSIL